MYQDHMSHNVYQGNPLNNSNAGASVEMESLESLELLDGAEVHLLWQAVGTLNQVPITSILTSVGSY